MIYAPWGRRSGARKPVPNGGAERQAPLWDNERCRWRSTDIIILDNATKHRLTVAIIIFVIYNIEACAGCPRLSHALPARPDASSFGDVLSLGRLRSTKDDHLLKSLY